MSRPVRDSGPLDLLSVGHVTCDLQPQGGSLPGGAAFFSGRAALAMGLEVGLFTSLGPAFPHRESLRRFRPQVLEGEASTVFENHYKGAHRTQFLRSLAPTIDPSLLPQAWRRTPAVYLCPVMGEVPLSAVERFSDAMVVLGAQGWMRRQGPQGRVEPLKWRPSRGALERVSLVVLSDEDALHDEGVLAHLVERVPLVAFTQGRRGGLLYENGRARRFPAFPTREVDPTGAGDVFGAAMLLRLASGASPLEAAYWGACVSSLAVEAPGAKALEDRQEMERRMARLWGGKVEG
jgi:1D-myo-inositol 3-kinase